MFDFQISEAGLVLPPTSLREAPALAKRAGVARVLLKLENERPLGNFKVLGGMYAGLRALAARAGMPVAELAKGDCRDLPSLICASAGNHGLSVAAAAAAAGTTAVIYLARGTDPSRIRRIEELGGLIELADGSYDDAVERAAAASNAGRGLLISDTSQDPSSAVVEDVMRGYATIASELELQLPAADARLTHCFVQAGVGGLAAAVADGLRLAEPGHARMIIVEPRNAACVGLALAAGVLEHVRGELATSATMLACGLASASAIPSLRRCRAQGTTVSDRELAQALSLLGDLSLATTSSGAAGLAGLLHVAHDATLRRTHRLDEHSTVLLLVTEGGYSF